MSNLFVSTTFLPDSSSLKDSLMQCKEKGVKGIEIGSNHCYEENYDYIFNFEFEYITHNYFPPS